MPQIDHEKCIGCGCCADFCDVFVIKDEKASVMRMDYCDGDECGVCEYLLCPCGAITLKIVHELTLDAFLYQTNPIICHELDKILDGIKKRLEKLENERTQPG